MTLKQVIAKYPITLEQLKKITQNPSAKLNDKLNEFGMGFIEGYKYHANGNKVGGNTKSKPIPKVQVKTAHVAAKAKSKTKEPQFMTGGLWNSDVDIDLNIPTLNEFKINKMSIGPDGHLTRGNIIPKDKKKEEQLIFECLYDGEAISFKLFLYDDGGGVEGRIIYAKDHFSDKEYFKGKYKKHSNREISIWGIWAEDSEYRIKYPIIIELGR